MACIHSVDAFFGSEINDLKYDVLFFGSWRDTYICLKEKKYFHIFGFKKSVKLDLEIYEKCRYVRIRKW